jgi:hypothetical protein
MKSGFGLSNGKFSNCLCLSLHCKTMISQIYLVKSVRNNPSPYLFFSSSDLHPQMPASKFQQAVSSADDNSWVLLLAT